MKEISLDKIFLSSDAALAWGEMVERVLFGFRIAGTTFKKVEQVARVEDEGSLTLIYRLYDPNKGEFSMSVPPGHWTWRQ